MNGKLIIEKEGWTKKGVYDEPRLSELVELYKEMGFEVAVLDYDPIFDSDGCAECIKKNPDRYKALYTRK